MSNQEILTPWKEFVEEKKRIPRDSESTQIACPECGKRIYRRTNLVLTTYPPMHLYFCKCGWKGHA